MTSEPKPPALSEEFVKSLLANARELARRQAFDEAIAFVRTWAHGQSIADAMVREFAKKLA